MYGGGDELGSMSVLEVFLISFIQSDHKQNSSEVFLTSSLKGKENQRSLQHKENFTAQTPRYRHDR